MFQKRVFKGVPDRWRRAVWGLMMERWAKEEEGRGEKVMGLKELEKLYFVRFINHAKLSRADIPCFGRNSYVLPRTPTSKLIWMFLVPSPGTSCSTPDMDKVKELSSTFCMPLVYIATA